MKRHASVPDGDYFQRMLQVEIEIMKLIEENISKTCSDNETKGRKEYQVLKQRTAKPDTASTGLPGNKEIGGEKAEYIHQPVPAKMNRADLN